MSHGRDMYLQRSGSSRQHVILVHFFPVPEARAKSALAASSLLLHTRPHPMGVTRRPLDTVFTIAPKSLESVVICISWSGRRAQVVSSYEQENIGGDLIRVSYRRGIVQLLVHFGRHAQSYNVLFAVLDVQGGEKRGKEERMTSMQGREGQIGHKTSLEYRL